MPAALLSCASIWQMIRNTYVVKTRHALNLPSSLSFLADNMTLNMGGIVVFIFNCAYISSFSSQ